MMDIINLVALMIGWIIICVVGVLATVFAVYLVIQYIVCLSISFRMLRHLPEKAYQGNKRPSFMIIFKWAYAFFRDHVVSGTTSSSNEYFCVDHCGIYPKLTIRKTS